MSPSLSRDQLASSMLAFIRERFLSGDPEGELAEDTPLIDYGILNSLNTAILIAYVQDEFDISVPLRNISGTTFQTVGSISVMLCDAATAHED